MGRRTPLLRTPTAGVLRRIERGDLEPFDLEARANVGTGVLERYLDLRGRTRAGRARVFRAAALGAAVAVPVAVAVAVAGLRFGLVAAFAWQVGLLVALAARRRPEEAAVVAAAALAGSLAAVAFLVAPLAPALLGARPGPLPLVLGAVGAAFLAAGAAALVRRGGAVEEPRPAVGADAHVRLLALAKDASRAAAERAAHGLRLLAAGAAGAFAFALARASLADAGAWWDAGTGGVLVPLSWVHVGFALSPMALGLGWLAGGRAAAGLLAGSAVAGLLVVPLAILFGVPVALDAGLVGSLRTLHAGGGNAVAAALAGVVVPLGAGALLGGAFVLLARRMPAAAAAWRAARGAESGRGADGWWAWPRSAALATVVLGAALFVAALAAAGTPALAAGVLGLGAALAALALAPVSWEGFAEGVEPVTPALVLAAVVLVALGHALGAPPAAALAAGLVPGVFAVGAGLLLDLRVGLHAGARPYAQTAAALAVLVPAAAAGAFAAAVLVLAAGGADLAAPQARAVAALAAPSSLGPVAVPLVLLGVGAGALVAALAGGVAFALGLLLPLALALPVALGALLRRVSDARLARRAEAETWDEERRLVRHLDGVAVAAGLVVGEALALVALAAYRAL